MEEEEEEEEEVEEEECAGVEVLFCFRFFWELSTDSREEGREGETERREERREERQEEREGIAITVCPCSGDTYLEVLCRLLLRVFQSSDQQNHSTVGKVVKLRTRTKLQDNNINHWSSCIEV